MPEVAERTIVLTSNLARSLASAYGAFQNGQIPQDFPLSQQDLYGIFDVLIQQNPLWEIDAKDPAKYEKVVTHLRNIADPQVRETAVVPLYFEDIQKAAQSAEDRRASFEMVKRNVERDIERLRTIYSAKPTPQATLEQEQKEAVAQAEQILREEKHIESIPESRAYRMPTPPKQEEEPVQAQSEPKHVDEIRKWVNDGRLARILHAVRQSQFPQESVDQAINEVAKTFVEAQEQNTSLEAGMIQEALSRALEPTGQKLSDKQLQQISDLVTPIIKEAKPSTQFFDIDQKSARVYRPVVRSEETSSDATSAQQAEQQSAESIKAKREAESAMYVLFFRKPTWQSLFGIGGQEDPRAQFENALKLVEIKFPNYAKKNALELRVLRANIESMIPLGEKIDEVHAIPQENLAQELQKFKSFAGAKLLEIRSSVENNRVSVVGKSPDQVFSQTGLQTASQAAKEKALSTGQNLLSQASVKLKNLFVNPGLGWLRGAIGAVLGIGGLFLPVAMPFKLMVLLGGGSLGLAQLSHSPQTMSAAVVGAGKAIDGLQDFAKLLANFRFQPTKMAGWVVGLAIALPITLLILSYNKVTNDQSIFIKELTSYSNITESKYIGLNKEVNPKQHAGALPIQPTFTITISAKEKALTNIRAVDTFNVLSRNSVTAPTLPAGVTFPTSLQPGESKVIPFQVNLGGEYQDSIVTNTITITADVEGGPQNESSTKSAAIIIGNPPTGCFVFVTGDKPWSETEKAVMGQVIAKMGTYSTYMTTLCSQGNINVFRRSAEEDGAGGMVVGKDINLYDKAFRDGNQPCPNLCYTFAHETGHVYAKINGASYSRFGDSGITSAEGVLPSYPAKFLNSSNSVNEDFAETIGVYISRKDVPNLSGYDIVNMATKWPRHFQFAKENFFGGQE